MRERKKREREQENERKNARNRERKMWIGPLTHMQTILVKVIIRKQEQEDTDGFNETLAHISVQLACTHNCLSV